MLKRFFQFLIGRSKNDVLDKKLAQNNADSDFVRHNKLTPIKNIGASLQQFPGNDKAIHDENTIPPSIVHRDAILDRNHRVTGYFFTLAHSVNTHVRQSSEIVQRLCDSVLLDNVYKMGIQRLLGHRLAFIPILPFSLDQPQLHLLASNGIVIVINSLKELVHKSDGYYDQLVTLKRLGFRIGLQGEINLPGLHSKNIKQFL